MIHVRHTFSACFLALTFFFGTAPASAQAPKSGHLEKKIDSQQTSVTLAAASISGTYSALAQDIQTALDEPDKPDGLRVLPVLGRGAGQNILDVLFLRGVDMAITQQEILEYFKRKDPRLHGTIYNRIRYIARLYNSELHILVPQTVTKLADLEGKKVNFYFKDSISDISATLLFDMTGVKVEPTYFGLKESVEKVIGGEIAASVYMAGAPVSLYGSQVKAEDKLRLLPLSPETLPSGSYEKLLEVFLPASLPGEAYPTVAARDQRVATIASSVVLAAYNWPEGSDRYRRIAKFVDAFFAKFDEFLKPPHQEKWKEIDLTGDVPGWTRFKAAQDWLNRTTASTSSPRGSDVPERAEEREKLFGDFMKWWQSRKRTLTNR